MKISREKKERKMTEKGREGRGDIRVSNWA